MHNAFVYGEGVYSPPASLVKCQIGSDSKVIDGLFWRYGESSLQNAENDANNFQFQNIVS